MEICNLKLHNLLNQSNINKKIYYFKLKRLQNSLLIFISMTSQLPTLCLIIEMYLFTCSDCVLF